MVTVIKFRNPETNKISGIYSGENEWWFYDERTGITMLGSEQNALRAASWLIDYYAQNRDTLSLTKTEE